MVLYASINNKKELKLSEEIDSINVQSGNKNYEQGEEGAWNLEKSAKWTGFHKAQITFDFDSIPKMKEHFEDILLVIDISGSMEGDKIDRVKSDSINLVEKILTNSSNRMGIITFSDESSMALDLTNNKLDIINKINNLSTVNNTNYYQALVNIERFFKNYQKEDNKDLVILFLTDGFPNQDTPNQEAQYKILKEQYPFIEIIGIQYEMGEDILEPIIRVSDGQYIADMDSLNNVLYAASNLTEKFEKVEIVDYINDDFKIESEEDIIPSVGSVKLEDENGKQKVIWTINSNMLSTGANANLKINVTLKEGSYNKEYVVTNDREEITVKLPNESEEKQEKQMNPTLKNKYTVTYNGNSPSDCSISNVPNIKSYSPYETVSIEQDAKCNNYNFKGWLIKNSNITKQSSKTFVMPEDNVDLVGRWGTLGVNKTQYGSVYKLLLSGYLISEANDSSVVEYSTGNKK